MFNAESSQIMTAFVDEANQREKKMVDMSIVKKGLNYHGTAQKGLEKERQEIKREEERMDREQALKDKKNRNNTVLEDAKNKANEEGKDENDEGQEGVLRMAQVQNLPEDCEMIVGQLKTLDFGKQDLDVLIELSKQLKQKRIELFPDTNYQKSLQQAGPTPEQIMRDQAMARST